MGSLKYTMTHRVKRWEKKRLLRIHHRLHRRRGRITYLRSCPSPSTSLHTPPFSPPARFINPPPRTSARSRILYPKLESGTDHMKRLSSTKLKVELLLLLFSFSCVAQFVRAEKNVKELSLSVDLLKKESKKLLERLVLAEKDMNRGYSNLINTGTQIQNLARSVYKTEAKAADMMDLLRDIPGREALNLRADVASMASHLQQKTGIDKRIIKISELGVPV